MCENRNDINILLYISASQSNHRNSGTRNRSLQTHVVPFTSGLNACKNVAPSSGSFVTCVSTLSLDEICQSNQQSTLTW